MKIVNVIGGLGNQMFQYAFAIYLQCVYKGEEVLIDIHHFSNYDLHNGYELSKIFKKQNIQIANKKQIKDVTRYIPNYKISRFVRKFLPILKTEYIEKQYFKFDLNVSTIKGNCYYEGYWQAFQYYNQIRDRLIAEFQFPEPNAYNKDLRGKIRSCNSVGIHIRRGDYLNHKDFKGICEIEYYQCAIKDLLKKVPFPSFYIFSNDIRWCEENIQPLINSKNVTYVSENKGNDSFWDLYLMSNCRNLIIANSSFSWWGAFLNNFVEYVYVPKKWINGKDNLEIYDPKWIKI